MVKGINTDQDQRDRVNRLVQHFFLLQQEKRDKLNMMYEVSRYMDPTESSLLARSQFSTQDGAKLYDVRAMNAMAKYTKDSLSDIINPFDSWFSLGSLGRLRKEVNRDDLRDWSIQATEDLFQFVNESNYYLNLKTDKKNYDLYGFSALTLYLKNNKLMAYAEDPYSLYFDDDRGEISAIFWVIERSAYGLFEDFNYVDASENKNSFHKFKVLCCLKKEGREWVQRRYLLRKTNLTDLLNLSREGRNREALEISPSYGEEIGPPIKHSSVPTLITRDSISAGSKYGDGVAKKIVVSAKNLNVVKREMLHTTVFMGNPPAQVPYDLTPLYTSIEPGRLYPYSHTGEGINFLKHPGELQSMGTFVDMEYRQISDTVPSFDPPDKRQRQTQFEVDQARMNAAKNMFLHKIFYLTQGVSQHLKRIFNLAIQAGRITPPPAGIDYKDVDPTLASLLLKEYKKQKARSNLEAVRMCEPIFLLFKAARDNINPDEVTRTIWESLGSGQALNKTADVEQIRKTRMELLKQREQRQGSELQAKGEAQGAKAQKSLAEVRKVEAETAAIEQEMTQNATR